MPHKAQQHAAHTAASNDDVMSSTDLRTANMWSVTGGRGGRRHLPPCSCARPRSVNSNCSNCAEESGAGQPWAMCQALTAERYFRAASIEMGSNTSPDAKAMSVGSGSVLAHRMKDLRSANDAGRRCSSGTENTSQKI
ncbi:hypothetical protein NLI96_g13055 [Meripilus lineatus]|uniref:Uncharacterized protein n=1 Tax=Meripilus lineatus TaxID=2056292 RepID=A0AAD5UP09_9APHY|nr:hypothetical protein NLI96_g13055 [Physisporinus lineatus]